MGLKFWCVEYSVRMFPSLSPFLLPPSPSPSPFPLRVPSLIYLHHTLHLPPLPRQHAALLIQHRDLGLAFLAHGVAEMVPEGGVELGVVGLYGGGLVSVRW